MALPDQPPHQKVNKSAKRDFQKVSGGEDDPSPAPKKHAGDEALPVLSSQTLDTVCASIQSSDEPERRSADSTYDYPGLEEDMSSIFDHSSSLHCSGSRHCDADISLDMDFSSWKERIPTSAEAFPAGASELNEGRMPRSICPNKTKSAFQQLLQLEQQIPGTASMKNKLDLLDEDIDWDEALLSPSPSIRCSPIVDMSPRPDCDVVPVSSEASTTFVPQRQPLLLRSYKTFFHISDMLSHKAELYKNQPGAVFELFARILYTNRDRGVGRQFFQLRDIITQNPPYLSGSLLN